MDTPLSSLHPGSLVLIHLADTAQRRGMIMASADGWIQLMSDQGAVLINLAHVTAIELLGAKPPLTTPIDAPRPRPVSNDVPFMVGTTAPARPWKDDDLLTLADAFLNGCSDNEIMGNMHRTRSQIRELRQGFECARGNVQEEDLSDVARTWVARWRRTLSRRS